MGLSELGRQRQPDRIHGFIFDGAVFLANIFLVRYLLASPIEQMADRQTGIYLSLGIAAHFLGALLKMGPLQYRLAQGREALGNEREQLLGCLSFLHFLFFLVATVMALALLGLVDLADSGGSTEWIAMSVSLVIAAATTGIVWLGISRPGREPRRTIWWVYQEIPADLLLWLATALFTRFFWTGLLLEAEPPSYMGLSLRALVYTTAASLLFLFLYLPARLLFLAEDYRYPFTWFRLWLVAMLPLLTAVFIP